MVSPLSFALERMNHTAAIGITPLFGFNFATFVQGVVVGAFIQGFHVENRVYGWLFRLVLTFPTVLRIWPRGRLCATSVWLVDHENGGPLT